MPSVWDNLFGADPKKKKKRSRPTTPKTPNPTSPEETTEDCVYHDADGNIVKKRINRPKKKRTVPVPVYGTDRTYTQRQRRRRLMPTRFLYV